MKTNFETCNKAELIKEVAKKIDGVSKRMVNEFVDAMFETIQEQLLDGRSVNITGIGRFNPFIKKGATYIDLSKKNKDGKLLRDKNGKPFTKTVPNRYSVKFSFTPSFVEKVKQVPVD